MDGWLAREEVILVVLALMLAFAGERLSGVQHRATVLSRKLRSGLRKTARRLPSPSPWR